MSAVMESVARAALPAPLPQGLLRGKVAVVTGGSRGIGRATVLRLAEAGAHVLLTYSEQERRALEVEQAAQRAGVGCRAIRADAASESGAAEVFGRALEEFGRVDLVVANAGIWHGAPVEALSDALWDSVLDVNLKGTFVTCRAAAVVMKQNGGGSIVVVSSTAGQRGEAGYSNYAASKGGQISFAKSLAVELAPAIRVNCVAPGWVDTELNEPVFSDVKFRERMREQIPLRRIADPDDVALSIVFLASDWARHITGEVLNINGGAVLCG